MGRNDMPRAIAAFLNIVLLATLLVVSLRILLDPIRSGRCRSPLAPRTSASPWSTFL